MASTSPTSSKCRPPGNRNPEPDEIAACAPYLRRQIALAQPKLLLAAGKFSAQTLLNREDTVGAMRASGGSYGGNPGRRDLSPVLPAAQPGGEGKSVGRPDEGLRAGALTRHSSIPAPFCDGVAGVGHAFAAACLKITRGAGILRASSTLRSSNFAVAPAEDSLMKRIFRVLPPSSLPPDSPVAVTTTWRKAINRSRLHGRKCSTSTSAAPT